MVHETQMSTVHETQMSKVIRGISARKEGQPGNVARSYSILCIILFNSLPLLFCGGIPCSPAVNSPPEITNQIWMRHIHLP